MEHLENKAHPSTPPDVCPTGNMTTKETRKGIGRPRLDRQGRRLVRWWLDAEPLGQMYTLIGLMTLRNGKRFSVSDALRLVMRRGLRFYLRGVSAAELEASAVEAARLFPGTERAWNIARASQKWNLRRRVAAEAEVTE